MATIDLASVGFVQTTQQQTYQHVDTVAQTTLQQANTYTDSVVATTVYDILEPLVPPPPSEVENQVLDVYWEAAQKWLSFPTINYTDAAAYNALVEAKAYANLQVAKNQAQSISYANTKFDLSRAHTDLEIDAVNIRIDELSIAGFTKDQFLEYVDWMDEN